jgi:protein-L-isoaspartate(D-aspartate) O-methyltransferase
MLDYSDARLKMVDNQLRPGAVSDHRLLAAMGEVPRELFVPTERQALAYADLVHPVANGRFLAAPTPFARLVQLAEIKHSDHVLVVGAGVGYGVAVISHLAAEVAGLEVDPALAAIAESNLARAGVRASIAVGEFDAASLLHLRFDAIVVEGMVDAEPTHLFPLLSEGGRLVALVRGGGPATAIAYVKSGDEVTARSEFNASLPPLPVARATDEFRF